VVGTPEYMSPEQLMGERLDGRSDVYSLAIVLFRMLTGSLPFRADTTQDVMLQRLTEQPLRLDQAAPGGRFPAGLQAVLDRGLQRRAVDRYDSAATFGRDVVAALEGQPVSAAAPPRQGQAATSTEPLQATMVSPRVTSTVPAAGTGSGGHRGLVIGAVAAVVVVGGVVGVLLLKSGAPSVGNPLGASEQMAPGSTATATQAAQGPANPTVRHTSPAGASQQGQADQTRTPGGTQTPPAQPPAAATAQNAGGPNAPAGAETPAGNAAGSGAAAGIAMADLRPTLDRQMDLISLGATPPSRATLMAVRDTAEAGWALAGASAKDKAYAAYIVGSAVAALGDTAQAFSWMQRAVNLQPGERGYQQMLDLFRRPKH
jgi:Protein kinase domain